MTRIACCVVVPVFALLLAIVMIPLLVANVAWWYLEELWKGK